MINEVEGLSALTLHDSHADLFDVLITWLFTLEGIRGGKKQDCRILRQCWKHLDLKGLIDSTRAFKSVLQTAEEPTLCSWSSLFLRFFLTYWRSLRASDSRSTPVTLHAPWSGCARRALDARLTSVALRTPISMFTRVTDLSRTQGSVPGGYYKAALVFSTLRDSERQDK